MSKPRFHIRKLTAADGERILWHVLEYLIDHYGCYSEPVMLVQQLLHD